MFYRRYKKRFLIYTILALVLVVSSVVYFMLINSIIKQFDAAKNGIVVEAEYISLTGQTSDTEFGYWRYYFVAEDGTECTGVTKNLYTRAGLNSLDKFLIRYAVNADGSLVLSSEEKFNRDVVVYDGDEVVDEYTVKCSIPLSYEDTYFEGGDLNNFRYTAKTRPKLTGVYMLSIFAVVMLAFCIYNFILIQLGRRIEKKGEFEYAVFEYAKSSKFGSSRYMSVTISCKNALGEFYQFHSPYTYYPMEVEQLKSLEAITIKRYGDRVVIVEKVVKIR